MDECFAITTYCNSVEKINVLKKTIDNIKQYNIPIYIHAHYPLPTDIQKNVKAYFYSSDNPILKNRYNKFWHFIPKYKLEITVYDYYFTTLKGWSELIDICYNYDRIHMINYDTNMTPELFDLSKKYPQSIFLQNKDTSRNCILPTYFCLNKKSYDYFNSNITLEKYISFDKFNGPFLPIIEEFIPTFLIDDNFFIVPHNEYDEKKLLEFDIASETRFDWNNSLDTGFCKIFVGELNDLVHLLLFDIKEDIDISVIINDMEIKGNDRESNIFNLNLPFLYINTLRIIINGIFVPDELIKKFFQLECKIYKE